MHTDRFASANPVVRRMRRLGRAERREEALDFLEDFARTTGQPTEVHKQRRQEVLSALREYDHYEHTPEELAYGARVAWRNHARCIGRLWWKSLEVRDCRSAKTPAEIASLTFAHMRDAFNNGRIRSCISIFPAAAAGQAPITIESPQVIQYAGYLSDNGKIIGDAQNIELTRTVRSLGWNGPSEQGHWDILPLLIRDAEGHRHIFSLPDNIQQQVDVQHPNYPQFNQLNLKWYAVPCVANMILTIGGIEYPCAPFNGHYMGTEIASRDFVDQKRYDLMTTVADAMGFPVSDNSDPMWRDRALTELNFAVIHSFRQQGIEIVDHHAASAQFMEFVKREQKEGRTVSADWSWIVPPQAGAACPVFHLPMENTNTVPNFFMSRAIDGGDLYLDRRDQRRNRWQSRYDRAKKRWRKWRRQRDSVFSR